MHDAARIASYIDHTCLKPDARTQDIERLCQEARFYGFAAVCVMPVYVEPAADFLKGTSVRVCTVAGFPLGAHYPGTKAGEAQSAAQRGASEVDMVIQIGALKDHRDSWVEADIRAVVDACRLHQARVKVILETGLLSPEEKKRAVNLAVRAGAAYVKTSTGTGYGGAEIEDVCLFRKWLRGTGVGIKASGGIRSLDEMLRFIEAGASRIGTSAAVSMMQAVAMVSRQRDREPT